MALMFNVETVERKDISNYLNKEHCDVSSEIISLDELSILRQNIEAGQSNKFIVKISEQTE